MRLKKTKFNVEVTALLQRKIFEIEEEYRDKPIASIPEDPREEDFGSEFKGYKWRVESKKLEFPDIGSIIMAQNDEGTRQSFLDMMKKFTTILSEAIREVKITVIYTGGKKPVEYASTLYFIDYEKGLNVPGADGSDTSAAGGGPGAGP